MITSHERLNTSYLTDSYIHRFYPQNGIRIVNYNFWPKNDGEKWATKNIFEIPPCAKSIYLKKVRIWVKNTNSVKKITYFSLGGISKKIFEGFIIMRNETLSQNFHPNIPF